jgi:hypothetical protein
MRGLEERHTIFLSDFPGLILAHWPDHSIDIIRALDYFGVSGRVIGIGHSFGGGTL